MGEAIPKRSTARLSARADRRSALPDQRPLFPDPEGLTAAMLLKQATRAPGAEQGRANRGFIQPSDTYFHERGGKP